TRNPNEAAMPRDPWRDHPEYVALWRMARQRPDDPAQRFVLADWLEENGQPAEAWRERVHGITGSPTRTGLDTGLVFLPPMPDEEALSRVLELSPPDEIVVQFGRTAAELGLRFLREYPGRCGVDVGRFRLESEEERAELLAIPRLEAFACERT